MTPIGSLPAGAIPSGNVTWNGQSIECLGICTGQSINKIVKLIADKVCELADPEDLSTLTLQCALDIFSNEESGNRTIASVLQLLIDNECGLKELIDSIQAQVDGISEDNLVLDLKCLGEVDGFGNPLPYTNETVLQSLINELCDLIDTVDGIAGEITNLQNQINDLISDPYITPEVVIDTCISADTVVSQAVIELAADYCDYKEEVGSTADIQEALSLLPPELDDILGSIEGWSATPSSMAQLVADLCIAIGNYSTRLTLIESTCCAVSCADVLIGFAINVDSTANTISLVFTSANGTEIPGGFTDAGSSVTITDKNGASKSTSITITQDVTISDIDISGLDTSEPLIVNVTAVMSNEVITCSKCSVQEFSLASGCAVCAIVGSGTEGTITIVYQPPTTNFA